MKNWQDGYEGELRAAQAKQTLIVPRRKNTNIFISAEPNCI
jgi:hypothetical protein